MFKILNTYSCWKKNIKCNIWRVAVRLSYIQDARFLKVNLRSLNLKKCFEHLIVMHIFVFVTMHSEERILTNCQFISAIT
jgi:hypothetical protein